MSLRGENRFLSPVSLGTCSQVFYLIRLYQASSCNTYVKAGANPT